MPDAKNKNNYHLPQPCDILRYNTSKRIGLVGLKGLTIQLYPKVLLEPVVAVPKQWLPDYEVLRVLALRPQPHRADQILPVSPVLVWQVQLSAG